MHQRHLTAFYHLTLLFLNKCILATMRVHIHQTFLTFSQMTNFRLVQIERVCRRQFQFYFKWQKDLQTGRNYYGKRRNFSFSHSVFKRLVLQTGKNQGLFGKGLTHYHTMPHFDALKTYSCGKNCEKRKRNAWNKLFLLSLQCFLPYMASIFHLNAL